MGASVIFGFSQGANRGFSGGPTSSGQNCTACHEFNESQGTVEVFGIGRRYRADAVYDLTVRISDPEQIGAGFELSVEDASGHSGTLLITDVLHTQEADQGGPEYITHSLDGYLDSLANLAANGGFYEYHLQWQAPSADEGPVTIFVAGQATNNANAFRGDHYHFTHTTAVFVTEGDADADTDLDLLDFALLQRCFGAGLEGSIGGDCALLDYNGDAIVALADADDLLAGMTGPTATVPGGYRIADLVRGGLLYDKWWKVTGADEPAGEHPLYPDLGQAAGSATFRCKECHGWDYEGREGAYNTGSHFTDIVGVQDIGLTPQELFDLLTADPIETPNGHDMDAYGMTEQDVWDVVKMTREGVIETDEHIDVIGDFIGSSVVGESSYRASCGSCHGQDGTNINFGSDSDPEYVGGLARRNPWEFLHKVRFGHPGSSMPSAELLRREPSQAADIGAYSATLP